MKSVEIKNSSKTVRKLRKKSGTSLIRVTDHGKPVAYILPTAIYDLEDIGYMTDPAFWKAMEKSRNSEEGIPLEEVMKQLEEDERREASRKGNGLHGKSKRMNGRG